MALLVAPGCAAFTEFSSSSPLGAWRGVGPRLCAAEVFSGRGLQIRLEHEIVILNGATVTVKVAHMRLCHSRMPFARAYPRETQEMAFDAHDRAFAFFRGACTRGIYDWRFRRGRPSVTG